MAIVSDVEIRLRADIARLQQDLTRARQEVNGAIGSMSQAVERFKGLLGGLALGAGFTKLAGDIIEAQREFDKFNSALITATGSTAGANKAFAALQRFAATTPFDLKQTVDAFLKLRNMGLDPSERALRSYGNTAGALGKSLNQMVEAVADAATGEFERLKEFGIKAAQNGDSVRLTFQGVSTSVANNAKSIQEYLLKLGETKFAGGMELQAKTLDGAISNLGDNWQALLRAVSQSGFGDAVHNGVIRLSDALQELSDQIRDGGPIIEGLKLAAKLTAAYLAAMAAPAVVTAFGTALSTVALNLSLIKLELRAGLGLWGLFNTALTGTSVSAALAAGSLTKLQLSLSILFAAFAGWEIGKYLDENFVKARIAGEVFVGAMLTGWENIKYGAEVLWTAIKSGYTSAIGGLKGLFADFVDANAKGLAKIGATDTAKSLQEYADQLHAAADAQMTFDRQLALINAGHDKAVELINRETDARVAAAVVAASISQADHQQTGDALKGLESKAEATKQALDWYKQTLKAAKDAYDQQVLELQSGAELTAEEKKRVEVRNELATTGKTLSAQQKKEISDYLDANVALGKYNDQQKKAQELRDQRIADARAEVAAAEGQTRSLQDQVKYYGLTEEAVLKLKAAELARELQNDNLDGIARGRLEGLLDETREQIKLQTQLSKMKAEDTFWKGLEDTAHQTFLSIANGSKDAATRLKETFKNIFFDWLYQQTIKKWIIQLSPEVAGGGGGLASLASGVSSAFSNGSSSSGGGLLGSANGLLSAGKLIYQGFSGGLVGSLGSSISSLGATFGSEAVSAFGAGLSGAANGAATASAASGYAGTTAAGAGAGAAGAIPIIGWIIAGMMASKGMLAQGWDSSNGSVSNVGRLAGGNAAIWSDTVLQKLGMSKVGANILSGQATIARMFGRKNPEVESSGLRGTISTSGIDAQNYANILQKGGWFRSDKRWTQTAALGTEADTAFDTTIKQMVTAVKGFGTTLVLEASLIDGYTKSFDLKSTGDAAKDNEALAALLGTVGDEMSLRLLPSLTKFAAEGETASTTLQRLAVDFVSVDSILSTISGSIGKVGLAGIEIREGLIKAAGGIDALASGVSYFQQNFLSDAEKLAPVQKALAEGLAAIGMSGLKTNEQFKLAVQGFDWTQAGAAELYVKLLALAPAFKAVTDATEAAAKAQADAAIAAAQASAKAEADRLKANEDMLKANINTALSVARDAVDARKAELQTAFDKVMDGFAASIDAVTARITDLRSLSSLLAGVKVSGGQNEASRAVAQAQIEAALATAKASGVLPSADSIRDAVAAATQVSTDQFATLIDYQRAQARASSSISALAGLTDDQLNTAEKTLLVLNNQKADAAAAYARQISTLDSLLASTEKAAAIALGTYQATLGTNEALATVAAAIEALKMGATPGNPGGTGLTVEGLYSSVLGRTADAGGLAFWKNAFGDSIDSSEYARFIQGAAEELAAKANGTWAEWLGAHGAGSSVPTSTSAMQTALDTLNDQMAGMSAAMNRTAAASTQFAQQFDQVSAGGSVLLTEPTA